MRYDGQKHEGDKVMKEGDSVFQVYVSEHVKRITEFRILKVNPKTIVVIGENDERKIKKSNFEKRQDGLIIDSFIQYSTDIQSADILSIHLMDAVINKKYHKAKKAKEAVDRSVLTRNTAPKIRRLQ